MSYLLQQLNRTKRSIILKIFILFSIALYLLVVSYIPLGNHNSFQSADENGNHITTKLYAETGKLYYYTDYSRLDYENYLHPRSFITYNGRVVFTQFFGLPIVYGPIYLFFEDNVGIVLSIVFSLLSLIFFVKTVSLIFPKTEIYAIIAFLSILPIIYYFNHPYFNATPAISFFIIAFYYLVKFYKFEYNNYYLLSVFFFSISMFCRNNYGIFIFILLTSVLVNKYTNKKLLIVKYLLISGIFATVFAILPTALLNFEMYGSPLLHGNALLNEYIIGLPPSSCGMSAIFFPSPVIPEVILKNMDRLFLKFLPIVSFLSIIGLLYLIREKKLNRYCILYLIFFIYLLCYRGSSLTYNAYQFEYIGLNVAIIRYWLIAYIVLALFMTGGLLAISKLNKKVVTILCITILIITSINTLFVGTQYSLIRECNVLSQLDERASAIQKEIGEESIVYSCYQGKILSLRNIEVASWWQGTYDPIKLTDSMARMYENTNYSIYLYKDKYADINELNEILRNQNLTLKKTENVTDLYTLTSI